MLINPKTVTLDEMDRTVVLRALASELARLQASRAKLKGLDEKSRRAIDKNEMKAARITDLIAMLERE